jgi:hypothetical protein
MAVAKSIDTYWENFEFTGADLEYLYSYLLEREEPLSDLDLAKSLIIERIRIQRENIKRSKSTQKEYLPKETYKINDVIHFSSEDGKSGKVIGIRDGIGIISEPFKVMCVEFPVDLRKEYVFEYENHPLNTVVFDAGDDHADSEILHTYGKIIAQIITEAMDSNEEIVCIGGKSFPKALLININAGYLNLAEAVLEMADGGPVSTEVILKNIEFPTNDNSDLTEFSMNYALQEDPRFDEVGPAGETLWFLKNFEPDYVKNVPVYLKPNRFENSTQDISEELAVLQKFIFDELEFEDVTQDNLDEITIHLIFPHWRAGTLPLSNRLKSFFPTAFESNNVLFTFVDTHGKSKFPGWVIFSPRYVYGLREWYTENHLIPGSIIRLKKSDTPGEILISYDSSRANRDWLRTANINIDGNMTFNMLKQVVASEIDERMAIALPESLQSIEEFWGNPGKIRQNFEKFIISIMRELSKLNPQGHVHIAELYAAVNIGYRCPPGPIINLLHSVPWAVPLGDLYYRLELSNQDGKS